MGDGLLSMDVADIGEIITAHTRAINAIGAMKEEFNIKVVTTRLNQLRAGLEEIDPDIIAAHDSLSDDTWKPKTKELEDDMELLDARAVHAKETVTDWRNAVSSTDEDSAQRIGKIEGVLGSFKVGWEPPAS